MSCYDYLFVYVVFFCFELSGNHLYLHGLTHSFPTRRSSDLEPTSGAIAIGDRVVNGVEPKDRDIAMVFQSYALYPHKSVRQNIEFPLLPRGVDKIGRAHV